MSSDPTAQTFRRRAAALAAVLLLPLTASMASPPADPKKAFEPVYFSIATGSTAGTYFPVGSMIATIVSHPDGSVRCEAASACGPRGLIAQASASRGSVANVRDVAAGRFDSALAQADVTAWAYEGVEVFKGEPPRDGLRAIAQLYPETLHLVVARGIGVETLKDMKGKRLSVDVEGSGTHAVAMKVLAADRLGPKSVDLVQANADRSASLLAAHQLDGFFFVGGTPVEAISGLAAEGLVDLLPISDRGMEALTKSADYFTPITVPAGTYEGIGEVQAVAVGALWITRADVDEEIVYALTRALWDPSNRGFFARGHAQAAVMDVDTAAMGLPIPLHPGAERFYREIGLLPAGGEPLPGQASAPAL